MDEKWKDYFYKGAAVFLTVAMCILFFFVVFRFDDLRKYIGVVIEILMPFIYGGVIAYLLSPVCTWFERHLADLAALDKKPEKTAMRTNVSRDFHSQFVCFGHRLSIQYGSTEDVWPDVF